jgi:hypothetical protein
VTGGSPRSLRASADFAVKGFSLSATGRRLLTAENAEGRKGRGELHQQIVVLTKQRVLHLFQLVLYPVQAVHTLLKVR